MSDFPDLSGYTILQVAPELDSGGVEQTVLEVTEAIRKAGGRALLASRGGRLESEFQRLGGELIRLDMKSRNPYTLKRNESRLIKLITAEKVDLVHARSRAPAWSALWAARRTGLPFVTTYHGIYSGTRGLKRLYNSVMAKGDMVIANSDWTAAHVHAVHGTLMDRIVTIHRGVDLARFDPEKITPARLAAVRAEWTLKDDPRAVAFLPGRLTDWKGQRLAIAAFAQLSASERAGLVFVLAGDPQGREDYVATLRSDVKAANLETSVRIVTQISDMPAALYAADFVLAPSTRPEAFGRIAAEASAMQRPVLVADHGGARETVIEGLNGLRVLPGNVEALAAGLRALLALSPDARAQFGAAGRDLVARHFSREGLQAATLTVYKQLLDPRL